MSSATKQAKEQWQEKKKMEIINKFGSIFVHAHFAFSLPPCWQCLHLLHQHDGDDDDDDGVRIGDACV